MELAQLRRVRGTGSVMSSDLLGNWRLRNWTNERGDATTLQWMRFSGQVSEPSKSEPTATSEADSTVESSEDAQMETAALQQNLWRSLNLRMPLGLETTKWESVIISKATGMWQRNIFKRLSPRMPISQRLTILSRWRWINSETMVRPQTISKWPWTSLRIIQA